MIPVVLVASLSGATGWYCRGRETPPPTPFQTAEIARGRLIATFQATGTLEPEEVVAVGAPVAGSIESLGADPSDPTKTLHWGSVVQKGTVLAQIEKDFYQAQVQTAAAELSKETFDLVLKKAHLTKAKKDWKRAQGLFRKDGISEAEYDQAKVSHEAAKAAVEISKAQIQKAEAALAVARMNLAKTTITSPVSGVIIDQRVNVGQTVVAGASPSGLFLIARDLRKMEVWATVKEADAGKIRIGQRVQFSVDARPGVVYRGSVKAQGKFASRRDAAGNQPVGTYTVVVSVDNTDGKLTPYLAARLSFIVKEQSKPLLVPNAALAWQPAGNQLHPSARATYAGLKGKRKGSSEGAGQELGIVWVQEGSSVRPIQVRVGLSDGIHTEIVDVIGGELAEGTAVITG
jgi:HlyD family secretion protein